jgi:hypothetical protein
VNKVPFLNVKSLAKAGLESWPQLVSVLSDAQAVESKQAWRSELEPGFRPMRVKTGWTRDAWYVHAEIEDADIFNPEKQFNALSFMKGDVFEIFLRPCDQDAYFEFHVTPENQKLQLRFPSSAELAAPRAQPGLPPEWFISHRVIESRVRVNTATQRWEVAAEIPLDLICEASRPQSGSRWLFSFSRYDYTRGREKPLLSSTSPHTVLNFHRQEDWGELRFIP